MPIDLTGIQNVSELYSHHHLDALLEHHGWEKYTMGLPRTGEKHDEIKLMQKALEVPRLPLVPHRVFLYPWYSSAVKAI